MHGPGAEVVLIFFGLAFIAVPIILLLPALYVLKSAKTKHQKGKNIWATLLFITAVSTYGAMYITLSITNNSDHYYLWMVMLLFLMILYLLLTIILFNDKKSNN